MKQSRFIEEHNVKILKAAEAGVLVDELLREHGVSRAGMPRQVVQLATRTELRRRRCHPNLGSN